MVVLPASKEAGVRPRVHGRQGLRATTKCQQRSALVSAGSKRWRESSKFDIGSGGHFGLVVGHSAMSNVIPMKRRPTMRGTATAREIGAVSVQSVGAMAVVVVVVFDTCMSVENGAYEPEPK